MTLLPLPAVHMDLFPGLVAKRMANLGASVLLTFWVQAPARTTLLVLPLSNTSGSANDGATTSPGRSLMNPVLRQLRQVLNGNLHHLCIGLWLWAAISPVTNCPHPTSVSLFPGRKFELNMIPGRLRRDREPRAPI